MTGLRSQRQTGTRTPLTWVPDQSVSLLPSLKSQGKCSFAGRKELFTAESCGNVLINTWATTKYILFKKTFCPFNYDFCTISFQEFPSCSCMKVGNTMPREQNFAALASSLYHYTATHIQIEILPCLSLTIWTLKWEPVSPFVKYCLKFSC